MLMGEIKIDRSDGDKGGEKDKERETVRYLESEIE